MVTFRQARFRIGSLTALVGTALVLAACGSSSSSSSPSASAPASNSGSAYGASASGGSSPASTSLAISTAKSSDGTYLTGASGRALYLWVADHKGQSACSGACAKAWPPVIAKSMPRTSGGANSSDLSTITRSDGTKQLAYNGHPLYYFVEDSHAGMTKGQGSNGFGAKWWLVTPSGTAITSGGSSTAAASAPASGSSSGSSSSSGGGGWG
jgi:predicted lipoprotein with Yx(FWY)xxD motif